MQYRPFYYTILSLLLLIPIIKAQQVHSKKQTLYKPEIESSNNFDGNRIDCDMINDGQFVSQLVSGRSGMSWPKGNGTQTIYASGTWFGGKINGEVHVTAGEFEGEFVGGPWGSDPDDPTHKIYKVNKSELADPLKSDDFQNWPTRHGAPFVDNNNNGIYEPLPNGSDHPDFIGDQVLWMIMNDGDTNSHSVFNTAPMGLEVQRTVFGFDRENFFGDVMFVKDLIINKGENTIEEMYIGLWSDPDLGDASDDYVGCDTTLGMGIVYNDGTDRNFDGYAGGTPAVGYDFLQGPMVPMPGETAYMFGRDNPNMKNLQMTTYITVYKWSPEIYDPNTAIEAYNQLSGLTNSGNPIPDEYGGGKFMHPGDPTKDTGPNDNEYIDSDTQPSADRRMLLSSGPFTMAPRDSQEVVYGIINVAAGSALDSYLYLKEVDKAVQQAFDQHFAPVPVPPAPEVTYTTQANEINLSWDSVAEDYEAIDLIDKEPILTDEISHTETEITREITSDYIYGLGVGDTIPNYDPTVDYGQPVIILGEVFDTTYTSHETNVYKYSLEPTYYEFEGYNIYQYDSATGEGKRTRIATFDVVNVVTEIEDRVFDQNLAQYVNIITQHGNDSGLQHNITVNTDALNGGTPLLTNREYYFAVVSYGYNEYGIPRVLESSPVIHAIRPQVPIVLDVTAEGGEDVSDGVDHEAGVSDGVVTVEVVNPHAVTGHDYKVTFSNQDYYRVGSGIWIAGDPPVGKQRLERPFDVTGSTMGVEAFVAVGSVDLVFTFNYASPNGAWIDGIELTFPNGVTINSASYVDRCGGCWIDDLSGHINGQSIMWGNNSLSECGCFAGGEQMTVNVDPFDLPMTIGFTIYDDSWQSGETDPIDAVGTVQVTELNYYTQTVQVWNVTDMETEQVVSSNNVVTIGEGNRWNSYEPLIATNNLTGETYPLSDDNAWAFFDGIKVQVAGASLHTLNTVSWEEYGDVSPVYDNAESYSDRNNNGQYDPDEVYEDVGIDGWGDLAEEGYVSAADERLDPLGDDYDGNDNPYGAEGNEVYNPWPVPGEPYVDANNNSAYDDGETFTDLGIDGLASVDEPGYQVRNLDPAGDNFPLGAEGNGQYDVGEPFEDTNGDGVWTRAETFTDANYNGTYDTGYNPTNADQLDIGRYDRYSGDGWLSDISHFDTLWNWWGAGSSTTPGNGYPTVELRFVPMQSFTDVNGDGAYSYGEPYTWDLSHPNSGRAAAYLTWGGAYLGRFPVPFTAWNMDTDPATKLEVLWRDRDNNGQWDASEAGGVWNYIWISSVPYGQGNWNDADGANDWMWLMDNTGAPAYYILDFDMHENDYNMLARAATLTFTPAKDNTANDEFVFSTKGATSKNFNPKGIKVWPNPYFGYNPEEENLDDRQIHFTNLPADGKCIIRIFDLAGNMVRRIEHTNGTQLEIWDIKNNRDKHVASGMYIVHIETEDGDKILKLAVIQPS